jgi:hypothetical protein
LGRVLRALKLYKQKCIGAYRCIKPRKSLSLVRSHNVNRLDKPVQNHTHDLSSVLAFFNQESDGPLMGSTSVMNLVSVTIAKMFYLFPKEILQRHQ